MISIFSLNPLLPQQKQLLSVGIKESLILGIEVLHIGLREPTEETKDFMLHMGLYLELLQLITQEKKESDMFPFFLILFFR